MPSPVADCQVTVLPFVSQPDGDEVIIGHPDRVSFLAIPKEAAEVIGWLAGGVTIGGAQDLFREKYGESLDMEGFLDTLENKGFIRLASPGDGDPIPDPLDRPPKTFHFAWISARFARLFFNPFSLTLYGLLILAGIGLAISRPHLLPGWRSLAFQDHFLTVGLMVLGLNLLATFLHEMGHLLAARSVGVGARMGLGNRLWVLVAETDVTGLWALPRASRYLPFLAGALVDAISGSSLLLLLFAWDSGLLASPDRGVVQIFEALLLGYILRITWQCYLFLRTDFYYVIANFFRCKDLLKDTEVFLKNQAARLWSRFERTDQSHIPRSELRFIRFYAWIWVLGRGVALYVFIMIQVPLLVHYATAIFSRLVEGPKVNPAVFSESLAVSLLSLLLAGCGLWLWFKDLTGRRIDHG